MLLPPLYMTENGTCLVEKNIRTQIKESYTFFLREKESYT